MEMLHFDQIIAIEVKKSEKRTHDTEKFLRLDRR